MSTTINIQGQPKLVSGVNIKTVNGNSVLGSGNLTISGGVSSVSAQYPMFSTGGANPDLSMYEADGTVPGYISTSDYVFFANKQESLVSGVNIKTINGSSIVGSGNLVVSGDTKFKAISSTQGASINGITTAISSSVFIPSGTLTTNSMIDVLLAARRQAGAGTVQAQIYLNSTNSLTGATLWAIGLNFTSNNWNGKIIRSWFFNGNTLVTNVPPSALANLDISTPNTPSSYTYNPATTDLYIMFAMANLSADNISYTNGYKILCY